ncbi:uncharacterized protein NDAI_0A03920 [Naumovozyma dairenensis CBS 421]|uniref:Uncharacterized protein n=1 Tax=Naumovozyma dairenensis (strain ATCC 10597 / BCRC 20456 / CBS 421 / NBRC 0211 / NRRL Y-12639) TaxID=1071378 RepID=G0W411_NAUDC|nr:hypothetical protein NDAI_0A03920 [Naumovozyma dairenensis CBS 421]CCD22549.1 hypothetical protein NDAI_0A03920 [Naumovozyma dairenensis CBS 421]
MKLNYARTTVKVVERLRETHEVSKRKTLVLIQISLPGNENFFECYYLAQFVGKLIIGKPISLRVTLVAIMYLLFAKLVNKSIERIYLQVTSVDLWLTSSSPEQDPAFYMGSKTVLQFFDSRAAVRTIASSPDTNLEIISGNPAVTKNVILQMVFSDPRYSLQVRRSHLRFGISCCYSDTNTIPGIEATINN